MHTRRDLDVIVVTHNSTALLPEFIRSARAATWPQGTDVRITVVDNASTDGTVELARALADQVLSTGGNLGFGAAVNLGVAHTHAADLLLANVDVRLLEGGWAAAVERLHGSASVVAPAVVDAHLASPGPFAHVRVGTLLRTHFARKEMRPAGLDFEGDRRFGHARIDGWPCGAAFLIRRSAFEAVGGYDPKFFLYMEETDLFWRLTEAGRRMEWVPQAAILHVGGGDVRNGDRTFFERAMLLGKVRFFLKHRGRVQSVLARAVLAADCLRRAGTAGARSVLVHDDAARRRAHTWVGLARDTVAYTLEENTAGVAAPAGDAERVTDAAGAGSQVQDAPTPATVAAGVG